jgi:hypothetical protein
MKKLYEYFAFSERDGEHRFLRDARLKRYTDQYGINLDEYHLIRYKDDVTTYFYLVVKDEKEIETFKSLLSEVYFEDNIDYSQEDFADFIKDLSKQFQGENNGI